jgi:hypothetical protein
MCFKNVCSFSTVSKRVVVQTCDNFWIEKFIRPVPLVTNDLESQKRLNNFVERIKKRKRRDCNNNQDKGWDDCSNNFQG